ncbi:MAG: thioredoxin domain-containing protein [Eubacteriales bacterium]|nr:thioredoxin domain-containing protein [Eubacteriales bacterium]
MSNHLKDQSSPYLLQHAENPVNWYPWCSEAFEEAERQDKPVFLSIGYSTCHWCHVMAHESFEDREIADILNRYFISIKVDREERPDIDSVYMNVCQALTGSGGWPMSIFMTAEQKPFYAGTYFPPESSRGMTGFRELLLTIADRWKYRKADLQESAEYILSHIGAGEDGFWGSAGKNNDTETGDRLPMLAAKIFSQTFDKMFGGFGMAPKFPTPHNLIFLTLYSWLYYFQKPESGFAENDMGDSFFQVQKTLEQMRRGGIFDHIGFGFSRYSTDRYYLVPHFEKMLYDNALLIIAYSAAHKLTGEDILLDTAKKTADYIFREMTGSDGEFYSAQDADCDGEEGKYYVWDYDEVCEILGKKKGEEFCRYFGITPQGNFEGKNIPNLLNGNAFSDRFAREREILYDYRKRRTVLHLDDKVLTSWNSLMICALTVLYRITGEQRYLLAAERTYQYIEENLAQGNVLYVSCRNNVRSVQGFLDEYAYYTMALLSLYEVVFQEKYLKRAKQICEEARRQFEDEKNGGYFLYGTNNDNLITRPKETYDGALPSGNSVMAYCLTRLSQITDNGSYRRAAESQLTFMHAAAENYPAGSCMFLIALLFYENPPQKITVVLEKQDSPDHIIRSLPLYADIRMLEEQTEEYKLLNGKTTYYVCKDYMCLPPVNEVP